MAKHFGTNGVRGKFDELTPELALKLAQAIGTYFKKSSKTTKVKILVARDCRLTGEILRNCVISGLASVGCDVVDLGIISSPSAEFMIRKLSADGLIIVTASHNPPEWNALKVVDGTGVAISHERGEGIEKLLDKIDLSNWNNVGKITNYELAVSDHIEAIKKQIDLTKLKRKKIVLDCGNGTTCRIAPKLLMALGMDIISINSHPDGRTPGRPSEPTEANVKELIGTVVANRADAGIAWDGDGDRVIFVDEEGNYVIGDKVFALCLLWKLGKEGHEYGDVVTTVATSRVVEDVATRNGSRVRYTAIGAPHLCEEMIRKPAIMGGEEVGGVIYPEVSLAKDGLIVAAKLIEALASKPLSKWLEEIPTYYNVKIKIEANAKTKKTIVARVLAYAKKNKLSYRAIDGVRIDFSETGGTIPDAGGAWVIVRASGTENYVRIFAEARSKDNADELVKEYEKIARGTN